MANNIKLPEELQAVEYIEYHPKQENIYVFIQPMRKYIGEDKWHCRKGMRHSVTQHQKERFILKVQTCPGSSIQPKFESLYT